MYVYKSIYVYNFYSCVLCLMDESTYPPVIGGRAWPIALLDLHVVKNLCFGSYPLTYKDFGIPFSSVCLFHFLHLPVFISHPLSI